MGFLWLGVICDSHAQIDTVDVQQPAQGITYVSLADSSKPWRVHLLEINPEQTSAKFRTHKAAADGDPATPIRQTLSEMWEQLQSTDKKPIAGINADFFNMKTGNPINIQISGNQPAYVPHTAPKRSQFGITSEGLPFIDILNFKGTIGTDQQPLTINGINNMPPKDGLTLINQTPDQSIAKLDSLFIVSLQPVSGQKTNYVFDDQSLLPPLLIASGAMKDSLLTLRKMSDTLQIHFQYSDAEQSTHQVQELVGGAVQLLKDGEEVIDRQLEVEGVGKAFTSDRHPRTAVGISDSGRLYMMVVDGRQEKSVGMSLYELANFMKKYNITDALNLDGGGSTSMIINGKIVNSPSDKTGARPVSNALFIIE